MRDFCGVTDSGVSHTVSRFFETEGIAVMTMIVSKYKIEIKEEPKFAGETFEERYARVTAFKEGLTTLLVMSTAYSHRHFMESPSRPTRVPLVFKRR